MTLIDAGEIASETVTVVSLNIRLLNDEPPRVTGTAFNQTYLEENGSIYITDENVFIEDNDNLREYRAIERVTVMLMSPLPEDVLVVNGIVDEDGVIEYSSCNTTDCYQDFLRNLEYNNTNSEPSTDDREVVIEVCVFGSMGMCVINIVHGMTIK